MHLKQGLNLIHSDKIGLSGIETIKSYLKTRLKAVVWCKTILEVSI